MLIGLIPPNLIVPVAMAITLLIVFAILIGPYLLVKHTQKIAVKEKKQYSEPKCVLMAQNYDGQRSYGTPPINDRTAALVKNILMEADALFHFGEERVVVYDENGKAMYTIIRGEHWNSPK